MNPEYLSHKTMDKKPKGRKCKDYARSFATHPKSARWSAKNSVSPSEVFLNCHTKFYFNCGCGHTFRKSPNATVNKYWCPFCSSPPQKLCEDDACQKCHENSFSSHPFAAHWSEKNAVTPRMVFKCSGKDYQFDCYCGHEFTKSLNDVVCGYGCPYCCSPPQKLCENDACQNCHKNSFASHPRSVHWSAKNAVTPRMVFKCSNTKYVFNCGAGHEFKAQVTNVTCKIPTWCPDCHLKTESKLYSYLKQEYGANAVERNVSFNWCVSQLTNRKCRFDFYMKMFYILIELDGEQHFSQVSNWKSPEDAAEIDRFKMQCAVNKRVSVVRLLQEDVMYDRIDWRMHLKNAIKRYEFPSCVFICEDKEKYKNHTIATVELDRSPLKIPDIGDLDIIRELFLE